MGFDRLATGDLGQYNDTVLESAWYTDRSTGGMGPEAQAAALKAAAHANTPTLIHTDTLARGFYTALKMQNAQQIISPRTDLVRNGEVCYWPNKGYGLFGAKVTMTGAPTFQRPELYNPSYLTLADISGTGAADLLYTGKNKLCAWINLSGNAFGEEVAINPLPATNTYSKLAVLDFLGNGTACIVWSSPLPQHAGAPLQYIDLMGGNKPYLLKQYHNGTGKEITLSYKSSTQYYLDDKKQGIRWATKLPFPVHCVSAILTPSARPNTASSTATATAITTVRSGSSAASAM